MSSSLNICQKYRSLHVLPPCYFDSSLTFGTSAEFFMTSEHFRREKHALFLPIVMSLSLTTSAVAAGLTGGSLGYSIIVTNKLAEQFQLAIESSAETLASLKRQITSLAE